MIAKAVDAPNLDLEIDQLVDWLEFCALFSEFRVARIDALVGSLRQMLEEAEDDIGEADRQVEQLILNIENEVELRSQHLGETYPFALGEGAEELELVAEWEEDRYSFYLVCLVTSHVTGSPILNRPPTGVILTHLRNRVFQILATLAMAGLANGPAISVGWPRRSGEAIVDLLQRAAAHGAGFGVRNPPGQYVPPDEKDGGIDVIAWSGDVRPPPTTLYFGQAASGNNWPNKPVSEHARVFESNYMQDVMSGNRSHATIIPHRVLDERFWNQQNKFHRALLDRLRLPLHAKNGLARAREGIPVDEADQMPEVLRWIRDYCAYAIV